MAAKMPETLILPNKIQESIKAVERANTTNFCELVVAARLDPAVDFVNSDLSEIDFSNCDLRGYNFTGADLTGCVGVNVNFDASTLFDKADVQDSCFEYYCEQSLFLSTHDYWQKMLDRFANYHFTTSINWIADNLNGQTSFKDGPWYVAMRLLDSTENKVIRSNILYFALPLFSSAGGHLNFLLHVLARHVDESSTVKSVATALASIYANERPAILALLRLLQHTNVGVRREAVRGLFNNRNAIESLREITDHLNLESDSELRRYLLRRVCNHLEYVEGLGFSVWTTEPSGPAVPIDYIVPLDDMTIIRIARRALEKRKFSQLSTNRYATTLQSKKRVRFLDEGLTVFEEDLDREITSVKATLNRLKQYGVPFDLTKISK
jgi:hypothetical protein